MSAPAVLVVVALVLAVAGYGLACAVWPFGSCPRCTGSGRRRSPSGRAWRECRRCRGSGRRVRLGRRLWLATWRTADRGRR